ncbi:MAG: hypothetical protein NC082_03920 [Clostridiales bacterium]|nr:hypothetical protein [Clostridiales bacterium]
MKRSYISLWLLLAVACVVVAAASCYDSIDIGGRSFKTASFYDELSRPVSGMIAIDTLAGAGGMNEASVDSLPVSRFPVPVDTASKTILFFGDSMLEGLSPRLAAYCTRNGHKLYTVIWYSSTTQVWGDCDTLSVFIRRYKPDYIFACLGANELFVRDIKNKRAKPLAHLLGEIGDRPLLWIGPPNWKDDTGINELLRETLPEGQFFLSDGMTFKRKSDGAHPTPASAREWMDSVLRWMPDNCLHPIKMERPDSTVTSGRPARVTLLQPLQ